MWTLHVGSVVNGQRKTKSKVLIKRHPSLLTTFERINSYVSCYFNCWHLNLFSECIKNLGVLVTRDTHIWGTTQTVTCSLCVKWITLLNGLRLQCNYMWCLFQAPLSLVFTFCFDYVTVHTSKPMYAQSQVCRKFHSWLTTMWKWCWLHHSVLFSLHIDCLLCMA